MGTDRGRTRVGGFLCLLLAAGSLAPSVYGEVRFATPFQERVFEIREGVFLTTELREKASAGAASGALARNGHDRVLRVSSSEFAIYTENGDALTAYDFTYESRRTLEGDGGREVLVVRLAGRAVPIEVELRYEKSNQPWMRKSLRVLPRSPAGRNFVVARLDVERLGYPSGPARGGGLGQPIFVRNHFFGLEYPQGHNSFAGGVITLSHYPGVPVGAGLESKTSVWGVAPSGQVEREFLETYVPSFAMHSPRAPYTMFNEAWNSGQSTTEEIALQSIAAIRQKLIDGQGLKINAYVIDGGWSDPESIWNPAATHFPHGFHRVQQAADAAGMRLGLWWSLTGSTLDTLWGLAHGYEAVRPDEVYGPYCIAGPKYKAALEKALETYLTENRVGFLKCDYNSFHCRRPGHGHPIEGNAALEAAVDAYIDVLQWIHGKSPDTRIAITTGMWLSPWWLGYADWVWLGGSDIDYLNHQGVPTLEAKVREKPDQTAKRVAEVTYRDLVVWRDFRESHSMFPAWALMTHGFYNWNQIGGAPDPDAGVWGDPSCCDEAFPFWTDHVVSVLLRGTSDWEMLLNLRSMTSEKWNYLGEALKWGTRNWDILSRTQMILGNPSKFELYGYTHFRAEHGLVSLRNPSGTRQLAHLPLSFENGVWDRSEKPLRARQIYPCAAVIPGEFTQGSSLDLTLAAYEIKVIEFSTSELGRQSELAIRTCADDSRGAAEAQKLGR